jgi:hypothetical protein
MGYKRENPECQEEGRFDEGLDGIQEGKPGVISQR